MSEVMMAQPAAVISCYQCHSQMAMAPGVLQAYCPSCGAANQMAAPGGIPSAVPIVAPVAPVAQVMTDVLQILAPQKGILMRQKLDIMEAFVAYEWRNKYKVASLPATVPVEWNDEVFQEQLSKGHLLTLKEESDCCERQLCRPRHSLKIKIKGGDDSKADGTNLDAQFERPFQCTLLCCCTLFFPQVLTASANGKETGKVIQHWPCINNFLVCQRHWRVVDGTGKDVYMIRDDFCCNANMCAPTICCPIRTIDILTPDMNTKVGSIVNTWPGCNARACIGSADNYMVNFPDAATPEDKFNLLGALILIEYMVFEKKPNNNNNNSIVIG